MPHTDSEIEQAQTVLVYTRNDPSLNSSPGTTAVLAAQGDDAVDGYSAYRDAVMLRERLEGLRGEQLRQEHRRIDSQGWRRLYSVGYNPEGFFGSRKQRREVARAGEPRKGLFGKVLRLFGDAGSDILHDLSAPLGAVTRGVRSAFQIAGEAEAVAGEGTRALPLFAKKLVTPSEWAQAWRETRDGERYTPGARALIQREGTELPERLWDIAIAVARKEPDDYLYGKFGSQIVNEAKGHPDFGHTVALASASHVSFGRELGHSLGLDSSGGAFKYTSALGDGLVAWYGDPLNKPLQAVGAARKAQFLIRNSDDVIRLNSHSAVIRKNASVASSFNAIDKATGKVRGVGGVAFDHPQLGSWADDLAVFAKGKTLTTEAVGEFMAQQADVLARMKGVAAGGESIGYALRQSRLGSFKIASKRGTADFVDWMAGLPALKLPSTQFGVNPAQRIGTWLRQGSNLYRRGMVIDPESKATTQAIFQMMRASTNRKTAERFISEFWNAADEDAKFAVYRSFTEEFFTKMGSNHAPGIPENVLNPMGKYHKSFLGEIDSTGTGRPYLTRFDGKDGSLMAREGAASMTAGAQPHQAHTGWAMPDLKEVAKAQYAMTRIAKMTPANVDGWLSSFMERVWKPAVIWKMGFPIRNAGEEVFRAILIDGPMPFVKGRIAASLAKSATLKEGKTLLRPSDILVESLAARTSFWMGKVGDRLLDADYRRAAALYLENGGLPKTIGPKQAYLDRPKLKDIGGTKVVSTGQYALVPRGASGSIEGWWTELKRRLTKPALFEPAVRASQRGASRAEAVEDVIKALKAESFAPSRARMYRNKNLSDGRKVGVTATEDEALRDWAEVVVEDSWALTHSPDGEMYSWVPKMMDDLDVDMEDLFSIEVGKRPLAVAAEQFEELPIPKWETIVSAGFAPLEKMMGWISREPIYMHNLAQSLKKSDEYAASLLARGFAPVTATKIQHDFAFAEAEKLTMGAVDVGDIRSALQQLHPTLFPFWHAQEQFLKRWAKAIYHDPSVLRRTQLVMNGLRAPGFLDKDASGQEFFVFPGSGFVQESLAKYGSLLLGDITLPIATGLKGQIRYVAPGLDDPFMPGVGPAVASAFSLTRSLWPEFVYPLEDMALGDQAGKEVWEQWVPSGVTKLFETISQARAEPTAPPSVRVGSMMMDAIATMDAAGLAPGQNATAEEKQIFIQRVRKWSIAQLGLSTIMGYLLPVNPQMEFLDQVSEEYVALMNEFGIEEAKAEFLRRHPNADAFTVFKTTTAQGAQKPLPSTEAAGRWLARNNDFVKAHGSAATWFLPQTTGPMDSATFKMEMAWGLRTRKQPSEFWREVQISADKDSYYDMQEQYRAARAGAEDKGAQDRAWARWRAGFLNTRPMLAEWLADGGGRKADRDAALGRLSEALADPRAPTGPDTDALREMVASYGEYQQAMASFTGRSDTEAMGMRRRIHRGFRAWAEQVDNLVAQQLWTQIIQWNVPEIQEGT